MGLIFFIALISIAIIIGVNHYGHEYDSRNAFLRFLQRQGAIIDLADRDHPRGVFNEIPFEFHRRRVLFDLDMFLEDEILLDVDPDDEDFQENRVFIEAETFSNIFEDSSLQVTKESDLLYFPPSVLTGLAKLKFDGKQLSFKSSNSTSQFAKDMALVQSFSEGPLAFARSWIMEADNDARQFGLSCLFKYFPDDPHLIPIAQEIQFSADLFTRTWAFQTLQDRVSPDHLDIFSQPDGSQNTLVGALANLESGHPFKMKAEEVAKKTFIKEISNPDSVFDLTGFAILIRSYPNGADLLAELAHKIKHFKGQYALASGLQDLENPKFEAALLHLINRNHDLLHITAKALESCGGPQSLEPLVYWQTSGRYSIEIRNQLHKTIRAIRNRNSHLEAGWLSVEDEQKLSGALSSLATSGNLSIGKDGE